MTDQIEIIKADLPPNNSYSWGSPDSLSEWDEKELREAGVTVAAYWYASGSYEGSGNIIFKRADGWRHKDMGHCSCYGPLDSLLSDKAYPSLKELLATFSDELRNENEPIIQALAGKE